MLQPSLAFALWLCVGCAQLPIAEIPSAPAAQARAVVFDIDGTLTPNVYAFTQVRPDAAQAVRLYADKGYKIIYLSTRFSLLQSGIPQWLADNGFPKSEIHVAQTPEDHNQPDVYKARILKAYQNGGWRIEFGYGDSSTDFTAYAQAAIPPNHVFALLRVSDTQCQSGAWKACLKGWTEHLPFIANATD
jgi:phosphatidate phosphatase PAH1